MKVDHRSYRRNLCSCEKKAEVKGLNPVQEGPNGVVAFTVIG